MELVESYPFGASQAVFWGSMPSEYSSQLAIVGYGGGIRVLDTSVSNDPEPWSSSEDSELFTHGFVRDVVVALATEGVAVAAIYSAAGIAGIARHQFDPIDEDATYHASPSGSTEFNAHCVAVYDDPVSDTRYVLAGSHDGSTGRLSIAEEDLQIPGLSSIATYATNSPVISLATSTEVRSGHLTVRAGTLCGGLLRFDLDLMSLGSLSAFPTPSTILTGGSPPYPSIRDIAILPTSNPPRAFLAAYTAGVHAVDLSTTTNSMSLAGTGWPITYSGEIDQCTGVALHVPEYGDSVPDPYLFVGFGSREHQVEWGSCSKPTLCGSTQRPAEVSFTGVKMYGEIDGSNPDLVGEWVSTSDVTLLEHATDKLAIRRYGGAFWIATANDTEGASILSAQSGSPGWTVTKLGDYGRNDSIPTSSSNDILVLDQGGTSVLYAAVETSLSTHSSSAGIDVLQGFTPASGILLSGLANGTAGLGGVIIGSKLTDGIVVFDPDPSTYAPTYLGSVSTNGRSYSSQITANSLDGQGLPWVYAVNGYDYGEGAGALRAFRLPSLTSPPTLRAISTPWKDTLSREMKICAVRPLDSTRHAVFISYGPTNGGSTSAGIAMIEANYNASSNPPLTFTDKGAIQACSSTTTPCPYTTDTGPGRVLLGAGNRIYCTLGCNGVLMADVDGSFSVSNQAWTTLCPTGGPVCATALGLADGLTIQGTPYLIVTYLNDVDSLARGTIRLFDTSSASAFAAGPVATFSARFQGVGITKDPTDANGKTFFIGEGRGGISKVVFGP